MSVNKKIALIGAGNIGGTIAFLALLKNLGDIVLYDVTEGLPQGKALDLFHACPILNSTSRIQGTNSIRDIADADVTVVTAGVTRKPGMSRSDLIVINSEIMRNVAAGIRQYAPDSFVIVVSNPLDAMVTICQRETQMSPQMVVGMAGALDSSRYRAFLSEATGAPHSAIKAMVLGGHGDEMVPIRSMTTIGGNPVTSLLSAEQLDTIEHRVRNAGGEVVSLLKNGSAFYSPAAAVVENIESFIYDLKKTLPVAALLKGEYGVNNLYIGVPAVIGSRGVERIIEIPLNDEELKAFAISAERVRALVDTL